jgi:hypothetical protein
MAIIRSPMRGGSCVDPIHGRLIRCRFFVTRRSGIIGNPQLVFQLFSSAANADHRANGRAAGVVAGGL